MGGIAFLSITGKVLDQILLERLVVNICVGILPETQCGFRPNLSTIDMIVSLNQVQETCPEQKMDLYVVFINLTKAFDSVNREALWIILSKLEAEQRPTMEDIQRLDKVQQQTLWHRSQTTRVACYGQTRLAHPCYPGVRQLWKEEVKWCSWGTRMKKGVNRGPWPPHTVSCPRCTAIGIQGGQRTCRAVSW